MSWNTLGNNFKWNFGPFTKQSEGGLKDKQHADHLVPVGLDWQPPNKM